MPSRTAGLTVTDRAQTAAGRLRRRVAELGALAHEAYVMPYRRTLARARRDEDDLLLVVALAESLGVPDPNRFHTLELAPLLEAHVHAWHRRLGMDRSPLEHVTCC